MKTKMLHIRIEEELHKELKKMNINISKTVREMLKYKVAFYEQSKELDKWIKNNPRQ